MDNLTIGILPFENLSKFHDIVFFFIVAFSALFISWFVVELRLPEKLSGFYDYTVVPVQAQQGEKIFFSVVALINIFYTLYNFNDNYIDISIAFILFSTIFFVHWNLISIYIYILFVGLIGTYLRSHDLSLTIVCYVILILSYIRSDWKVLVTFTIYLFFNRYWGDTHSLISDPFHSAEFIVATLPNNFTYPFSVFPNIGYFEEFSRIVIRYIINVISFGYLGPTIGSCTSIGVILTAYFIIKLTKRKLSIFTIVLALVLILDYRLNNDLLFIIICLTFYLFNLEEENSRKLFKNISFLMLIFCPVLFLVSAPQNAVMMLIIFPVIFLSDKLSLKNKLLSISLCLCICIPLFKVIEFYIITYIDMLMPTFWGGAIPIRGIFFARLFFISGYFISFFVLIFYNFQNNRRIKDLIFIITSFLLISYVLYSYGFGRIDPNSKSRMEFVEGVGLFFMFLAYSKFMPKSYKFIPQLIAVVFVCAFIDYNQIINFYKLDNNKSINSEYIYYPDDFKFEIDLLNYISESNQLIFYTQRAAIVTFVNKARTTRFSSPYVSLGSHSQNMVVDDILNTKSPIVYLGIGFDTFDHADIRARAPLVFKKLYRNDFLIVDVTFKVGPRNDIKHYLFSLPRSDMDQFFKIVSLVSGFDAITEKPIFSDFELGKSIIFFDNWFGVRNTVPINMLCSNPRNQSEKARITTEGNYYYAELKCGVNHMVETWNLGSIISINPVK